MTTKTSTFHCVRCDKDVTTEHYEFTTGYGLDKDGGKVCYACCADWDKADMIEHGKTMLYLTKNDAGKWIVTNWPASLVFPVAVTWTGKHNWYCVGEVRFVRFVGPDGAVWTGKQIGDYNEVCHCKRTKIDPRNIYA